MSIFRHVDRETGFLLPPSVDESLPAHHLVRFVVEMTQRLGLSAMVSACRGSMAYHSSMLRARGCATGMFLSRKLERATYDSAGDLSTPLFTNHSPTNC